MTACPEWGHFIVFAISAYYNLLFLYIIVSLLQSMAGMRIPDALRPGFRDPNFAGAPEHLSAP